MSVSYSLLITANPFSDSKAAMAVFKAVRQLDILSGDIGVFLPGFHSGNSVDVDDFEVVKQKVDSMKEDIKANDSDYHGDNAVFHVYCETAGDLYFNDVDFYKFMFDMTEDCPNIEYVGRTELVVLPVEDGKVLYDDVKSYNLEPFVDGGVKGITLIQFLLSVINLLKKNNKRGESQRLETINTIETIYEDLTKSYRNFDFTEVRLQIDNALMQHMKWTEKSEKFFISYSTKNKEEAETLKKMLEERYKCVWMAPEGIPVPMSYLCAIPAAIRISSRFIVLLSETSAKSTWVKREIEKAVKLNRRIDGVLVDGFSTEQIEKYESLDFLLSQVQIKYSLQELIENEKAINELLNN